MTINVFKIWSRFWRLRQSKRMSPYAGDLFGALVHHCNAIGRKNPFPANNAFLVALTGMSLSSMKKARTQLHELGAIGYVPGQKNKDDPWYRLYEDDATYKDDPRWRGHHKMAQDAATKMYFLWPIREEGESKSLVSTETIIGNARYAVSDGGLGEPAAADGPGHSSEKKEKSCAQKEKDDPPRLEDDAEYHKVPYWRALRTVWFQFNEKHFKITPSFWGRDHKHFRNILLRLERKNFRENMSWTEEAAKAALLRFLQSAIQDEYFLGRKFLLKFLDEQYDAIMANQVTGAFVKKRPRLPQKPAKITARPRGAGAQLAGPLQIVNPSPPPASGSVPKDFSPEEWRQMIEQDFQLTLANQADKIFSTGPKYVFLRKAGTISFKSKEHWASYYINAVELYKPESTAQAIYHMRRLVYLAYLRRAAERGKTSIFSDQLNSNHDVKPGSTGKAAQQLDARAVQGVHR